MKNNLVNLYAYQLARMIGETGANVISPLSCSEEELVTTKFGTLDGVSNVLV